MKRYCILHEIIFEIKSFSRKSRGLEKLGCWLKSCCVVLNRVFYEKKYYKRYWEIFIKNDGISRLMEFSRQWSEDDFHRQNSEPDRVYPDRTVIYETLNFY